ncbi:tyrosinase tyrosinase: common central domain protein [Rhizoctonia solani AG-3 Rhs1AP]|uniref:Tyrosinase tyrosinase: common central domain protein n=1 Tax=Rhizoctonia solani AG-3 Rhs1AP TaxID=1086054 RepID=X8IYV2_9AGAM|nr:tyrosinase tyrosinase: common central domain protein [Rhizoctonia solani AG-3 Rhs1AP]
MHGAIHGITGGDLAGKCPRGTNSSNCPFDGAPTTSSNEPLFHLHHGNVDRLWWIWQEKNRNNKFAFHGGSVQVNIPVLSSGDAYCLLLELYGHRQVPEWRPALAQYQRHDS